MELIAKELGHYPALTTSGGALVEESLLRLSVPNEAQMKQGPGAITATKSLRSSYSNVQSQLPICPSHLPSRASVSSSGIPFPGSHLVTAQIPWRHVTCQSARVLREPGPTDHCSTPEGRWLCGTVT